MKKVLKIYILLALISGVISTSIAQRNYVSGYVVDLQLDTIRGVIDYQEWDVNPERIKFRANTTNAEILFEPQDIIAFGVADEMYESGVVELETSDIRTTNLTFNKAPQLVMDTVFLRTLVSGEKSLFIHRNNKSRQNLFVRSEKGMELLLYKRYFSKELDGPKLLKESNKFRGQLRTYFKSCPGIHEQIRRSSYNQKSISAIFNAFYKECAETNEVYLAASKNKIDVGFGLLAGLGRSTVTFESVSNPSGMLYDELWLADFSSAVNATFGGYVEFVLPRNRGKWSFCNSFLFNTFKSDAQYRQENNENFYTDYDINIQLHALLLHSHIRYKYLLSDVASIFINGGLSTAITLASENESNVHRVFYTEESRFGRTAVPGFEKIKFGPTLGIGIQLMDHYLLELRWERINGLTDLSRFDSNIEYFYILAGYEF